MTGSSDFEAICRVKYKYGQVIDRLVREGPGAGADELRDVFTDDISLDLIEIEGMPHMRGIDEVIGYFGGPMPTFVEWMWHAFYNPIIDISGDRATGEWLLLAFSRGKDAPDAPPAGSIGRYLEHYVKTPAGWRTSQVKFKLGSRFRGLPY
jgi:hypothetical protein